MPWGNIPESLWPKMEKCVTDVMNTGKSKQSAIAICHTSIMGDAGLHFVKASMGFEWDTGLQVQAGAEDVPLGRILYFSDAIVAHVCINGNGDGLTSDGLKELAASLPLMPLNIAHNGKENMGVITAAAVRDWHKDGKVLKDSELVVSGVAWAENFPDEAKEIIEGVRKLSIEADGRTAIYHVDANTNAVTRYLFGLTARGVATTTKPADKGAVFDTENGLLMVANVIETINSGDMSMEDYMHAIKDAFVAKFNAKGSRTEYYPSRIYNDYLICEQYSEGQTQYHKVGYGRDADGNFTFADKSKWIAVDRVVEFVPIEASDASLDAQRNKSDAWYMVRDSFNRNHNRGGDYEVEDVEADQVVLSKQGKKYVAKYKVDGSGNVVFANGVTEVRQIWLPVGQPVIPFKQEDDVNELEKLQAQIADLQKAKEGSDKALADEQKAKAALQAELDTLRPLTEQVKKMQADLDALKKKADEDAENAKKAASLTAERAIELAPILGVKRVKELLPDLGSMDEKAFSLIAEVRKVSGARGPLSVGDITASNNGNGEDEPTLTNLFGGGA